MHIGLLRTPTGAAACIVNSDVSDPLLSPPTYLPLRRSAAVNSSRRTRADYMFRNIYKDF